MLTAALATATLIWNQKQQASAAADVAETEARMILNGSCDQGAISACLANAPC